MGDSRKIAITMGDPAGVGPEVTVKALTHAEVYKKCCPIVIGDGVAIEDMIRVCNLPLRINEISDVSEAKGDFGNVDIINQFKKYENSAKEVVFCGYGEPFLKKDMMKEFCIYLRKNHPQIKIRVNTNGHANAVYHSNIANEFKGLIDSASVSLNASTESEYNEICHPKINNAYNEVKNFIKACKDANIDVTTSVVTGFDKNHNIDIAKCEEISKNLGAKFRNREFITNGY